MSTEIHRLLDEAFAGVDMTSEAQDLKEEIRANLIARTAELEADGVAPDRAARTAVDELGDIGELLGTDAGTGREPTIADLHLANRVRPTPAFVQRAVLWSAVAVAALALVTLGATGVLGLPWGVLVLLAGIGATACGLLVGDSLSQETTTNHPMPENRAGGYALATFLAVYGLCFAGLVALGPLPMWTIVLAATGIVASIVLFAFLGATQTNRHKAWVRRQAGQQPPNRFESEPETAARFGVYTVAIWLVTLAAMVALGFTVGWWWALAAFVTGLAVMMLVLARMLFPPRRAGR